MDIDNNISNQTLDEDTDVSANSSASSEDLSCTSSSSASSSGFEKELTDTHDFIGAIKNFSDKDFKRHFRLSRATGNLIIADYISSGVCPSYKCELDIEREPYIFLWYVANTITFKQLGKLFGITQWMARVIIFRVASWMVSISNRYIKWPITTEIIQQITSKFEAINGIPDVVGALGTSHIKVKAPIDKIPLYTNRKKYCSIIMQAVVDSDCKFMDVFCGEPGSLDDCRVLYRSELYKKAYEKCDIIFPNDTFLVADCVYSPRSWLLTSYKDTGELTDHQRKYNCLHGTTRMPVENAFGMLKFRFRRLTRFHENSTVKEAVNITIACCALHNLCLDERDYCSYYEHDNEVDDSETEVCTKGKFDRREQLFNELLTKGIL